MAIVFYRERISGDYLSVDTDSVSGPRSACTYSARATAIQNLETSVCTSGVSKRFLEEECNKVDWQDIPVEWLVRLHKPQQ